MAEKSRVKFNPVTKEMEIEGSESFVTATLDKLQAMLSGVPAKKVAVKKEPKAVKAPKRKPAKKSRQLKKAPKATTGPKRGALSKAVLDLINVSTEGVSMAELKEKTGMKDVQIRGIIAKAKKTGKIKQVKWGVYGAA